MIFFLFSQKTDEKEKWSILEDALRTLPTENFFLAPSLPYAQKSIWTNLMEL